MAARFAIVSALTLLTAAPLEAAASDEIHTTPIREQLMASIGPGYAHVAKISQPVRSVTNEQLGTPSLLRPHMSIAIVGPLPDAQLRQILELVGSEVSEATKVSGDHRFAVVQLGDPQRDPCCTTTVLFEHRSGRWTHLGAITQSH